MRRLMRRLKIPWYDQGLDLTWHLCWILPSELDQGLHNMGSTVIMSRGTVIYRCLYCPYPVRDTSRRPGGVRILTELTQTWVLEAILFYVSVDIDYPII